MNTTAVVVAALGTATSSFAQLADPAAVSKEAATALFQEQMRALQVREDQTNYTTLLHAKERHDSVFEALLLPFLLDKGQSPRLATLEFDYRPGAAAIWHWPAGRAASECWATIRTNAVVRDGYPTVVSAKVKYQDDRATVDFLWHEPFLAYGRSGFCLTPSRTRLSLSGTAFYVTDLRRGDNAGSTAPQKEVAFRNPPHLYHWADTAQVLWACYPLEAKPQAHESGDKPARSSYALAPHPIRHETFFEMKVDTSEPLAAVPSRFRPSRELEYLSCGRNVSWSLNEEGALTRLTTAAGSEVLMQCTYAWLPPKVPDKNEDQLIVEADRRAAMLFTAINGDDRTFVPTFYTARELARANGLLARLRLDHNMRSAMWRANGEELKAAIAAYSELLTREGLGQDMLLYNLEAIGLWAGRYAPATDLPGFLQTHLAGAAAGLNIDELCNHAARAVAQSHPQMGSIYLALALGKPAADDTDRALLSWASDTLSAVPNPDVAVQPEVVRCERAAEYVTTLLRSRGKTP